MQPPSAVAAVRLPFWIVTLRNSRYPPLPVWLITRELLLPEITVGAAALPVMRNRDSDEAISPLVSVIVLQLETLMFSADAAAATTLRSVPATPESSHTVTVPANAS